MADTLVSQTINKLRSKTSGSIKTRKPLQVLQVSATGSDLVDSPGMMRQKEKTLKPSENSTKVDKSGENGKQPSVRRSKRKNLPNESKEVQNEDNPPKNVKKNGPKSSKAKGTNDKNSKVMVTLNQSSLDSFVTMKRQEVNVTSNSADAIVPIIKEDVSEHSIFQDNSIDTTLADNMTMRVVRSTSDEINMLTADEPVAAYWKMLAEQRRSALEIALVENEQLKNEIEVLEIENGQLKNVLQALESVVEVINNSIA